MNVEVLRERLAANPLPARAFVLMLEPELRALSFHEPAQAELERREARRLAKAIGDVGALIAAAPPERDRKLKDDDLRKLIRPLFEGAA